MCQLTTSVCAIFCQMGSAVMYPSFRVQSRSLPGECGLRITTSIVKRGGCAGRNPTNEGQTSCVYWPLTGICEVPVFPAWSSSKPFVRDVQPEPFCTTCCIIAVILAAV